MGRAPHFRIAEVKAAAERSLTIQKGRCLPFFGGVEVTAKAAVAAQIAKLSQRDFCHTVQQLDICDVYAVQQDGGGWYLKITILDGLVVVSFHPLEKSIRTASGREVKP